MFHSYKCDYATIVVVIAAILLKSGTKMYKWTSNMLVQIKEEKVERFFQALQQFSISYKLVGE